MTLELGGCFQTRDADGVMHYGTARVLGKGLVGHCATCGAPIYVTRTRTSPDNPPAEWTCDHKPRGENECRS